MEKEKKRECVLFRPGPVLVDSSNKAYLGLPSRPCIKRGDVRTQDETSIYTN